VAFPVLLGVVVALLLPPVMRARRSPAGGFATAVLIAAAALALHSVVDFPLEIPANAVLFGSMVASTVAMATDPRRSAQRRHRWWRPPRTIAAVASGRDVGTPA
jgi:hypothetical protein